MAETKRALTPEEQTKTIVVEFDDGPMGGETIRSNSDDPEEAELTVHFYLVHSDGGTIGRRYRMKTDADLDDTEHIYEVADRAEDETTIRVRFQYMGTNA